MLGPRGNAVGGGVWSDHGHKLVYWRSIWFAGCRNSVEHRFRLLGVWNEDQRSKSKTCHKTPGAEFETQGSKSRCLAKGAGVSVADVRELIKQYKQTKKMMKFVKGGDISDPEKMMKQFKGKLPKGFKI